MDWTELIRENLNSLITLSGTILGLFVGVKTTLHSQEKSFQNQITLEKRKSEESKFSELMLTYNSILMVNGENNVVEYPFHGNALRFNVAIYMRKLRPLLWKNFHLLHTDISKNVERIDEVLLKWNIMEEESYEGEEEDLADLYLEIIEDINNYVNLNRIN